MGMKVADSLVKIDELTYASGKERSFLHAFWQRGTEMSVFGKKRNEHPATRSP